MPSAGVDKLRKDHGDWYSGTNARISTFCLEPLPLLATGRCIGDPERCARRQHLYSCCASHKPGVLVSAVQRAEPRALQTIHKPPTTELQTQPSSDHLWFPMRIFSTHTLKEGNNGHCVWFARSVSIRHQAERLKQQNFLFSQFWMMGVSQGEFRTECSPGVLLPL